MAEEKGGVSSDSKLFGALSYIIAVLVPLFVLFTEKKNDKFLAFHAWQSLFLSVAWFAIFVVAEFVVFVIGIISGGLGFVLNCVVLLVALVAAVEVLFAAYKAYMGEMYRLPIIGDFAAKQAGGK